MGYGLNRPWTPCTPQAKVHYTIELSLLITNTRGHRYFFHASKTRTQTDGYADNDNEDALDTSINTTITPSEETESPIVVAKEEESDVKMDPALADWLKIEDKTYPHDEGTKYDSTTDDDSDNVDIAGEENEEDDLNEWFKIEKPNSPSIVAVGTPVGLRYNFPFPLSLTYNFSHRRVLQMLRWVKTKQQWNMTSRSFSSICSFLDTSRFSLQSSFIYQVFVPRLS